MQFVFAVATLEIVIAFASFDVVIARAAGEAGYDGGGANENDAAIVPLTTVDGVVTVAANTLDLNRVRPSWMPRPPPGP